MLEFCIISMYISLLNVHVFSIILILSIEKLLHDLALNTSSLSPSNQIISFQLVNKIKNEIQHVPLKLGNGFHYTNNNSSFII